MPRETGLREPAAPRDYNPGMPATDALVTPALYLIRLSGEITTKGRGTRLHFQRRLQRNLEAALAATGLPYRVERGWSRFLVETPPAAALEVLPRVFGVHSLSAVERRRWEALEDLVTAGEELFRDAVRGRRFAVRTRRGGDKRFIPFRSGDLDRALGARLLPMAAGVDLGAPEVTVHIEVREEEAYFFTGQVAGPGGLPLGTEGRALALVSGGFDSAVAAWALLKRGVRLDYLFCNLGGDEHRRGVLGVMKLVAERWSYGYRPRLHAIDFQPAAAALRERCDPRYWQVLLKRLMLHAANRLARQLRVDALVTGDAVGQVSSQTLQNLKAISEVAQLPILRPLVGTNKEEIVAQARAIGTFELSASVAEYCALHPRRPATHARLEAVRREEALLDLAAIEAAVDARETIDLERLATADLVDAGLGIEEAPPGAAVYDLRSRPAYDAWHYPGALHLDYFEALRHLERFERGRTHVLYCEVGLKSAHLAERLRAAGLTAGHFHGGLRQVMRQATRTDPALAALLSPALLSE
jgi:tRNA uracil 4-sulfurtransferase